VPMVGDAVRPCLGEGDDSESKFNIFNNCQRAKAKRCTFDFNHLHTMPVASRSLSIVALAMVYEAGASNGVGTPIRQA
jgi:hypothetical protein